MVIPFRYGIQAFQLSPPGNLELIGISNKASQVGENNHHLVVSRPTDRPSVRFRPLVRPHHREGSGIEDRWHICFAPKEIGLRLTSEPPSR